MKTKSQDFACKKISTIIGKSVVQINEEDNILALHKLAEALHSSQQISCNRCERRQVFYAGNRKGSPAHENQIRG